ncbi:MSMEG_0567/sll0787 family protein [Pseudonocardia endophytica]|uniref:Putative N-acetyltransferase (TIGR04045 family) n=1 Tax=Pseudonocardia endophytica TaxID=401976 RepID=A0A4R1HMX9_PSEEN|nr:MSMEG_0567/sll0787 family protein [Pseudonocardia endophytica]TCK21700.1 putative N-acetyltransferase (TIGR04045 family) [Pseudonocardia endophytica]
MTLLEHTWSPVPRWVADELLGGRPVDARPSSTITEAWADDRRDPLVAAYRALRRSVFVHEQGLFDGDSDVDDHDADPRAVVLLAHDGHGALLGGVRLGPADPGADDIGWWTGSRLVVAPDARRRAGARVGASLVRAACARAESAGALRFEADVQAPNERLFARLGWDRLRDSTVAGRPHVRMRFPIDRVRSLVAATKAPLGALLGPVGPPGFVGDDGAPVPGSDLVAACDAIVPAMVERDPEWAGWCGVLVNVNDLAAMGARPVGLLDAVGARDASFAHRVLAGVRDAAAAYGVPLLGGHTQLDVPASLSLTALGHTPHPVPAGGGRAGQRVRLTTDLAGGWRPGYTGRQWDSTTSRSAPELSTMVGAIGPGAAHRPSAAKDVSMAGLAGTLGMLAEACGTGAVLDVAGVPRPSNTSVGDWFTCFPGFGLLTADDPGAPPPDAGPATTAECGELTGERGVRLRWPDGETTTAVTGSVTGMGRAGGRS